MSGKIFATSSFLQECVVHSVRNHPPKKFESGSDGEKVRANFLQAPNSS